MMYQQGVINCQKTLNDKDNCQVCDDDDDAGSLVGRVDKAEKMSKKILECGASHGSSLG